MKKYFKMADVFEGKLAIDCDCDDSIVNEESYIVLESFDGSDVAKYAAHAINYHDELVAEVEHLRNELSNVSNQLKEADEMVIEMQSIIDRG